MVPLQKRLSETGVKGDDGAGIKAFYDRGITFVRNTF